MNQPQEKPTKKRADPAMVAGLLALMVFGLLVASHGLINELLEKSSHAANWLRFAATLLAVILWATIAVIYFRFHQQELVAEVRGLISPRSIKLFHQHRPWLRRLFWPSLIVFTLLLLPLARTIYLSQWIVGVGDYFIVINEHHGWGYLGLNYLRPELQHVDIAPSNLNVVGSLGNVVGPGGITCRHLEARQVNWSIGTSPGPIVVSHDDMFFFQRTVLHHGGFSTSTTYTVRLPLVFPVLHALSFIALCYWAHKHLQFRHRDHSRCIHCHYDLRAHKPGDKCPECGTLIPPHQAQPLSAD